MDVFLRAEDVGRCMCVSRQWHRILDDFLECWAGHVELTDEYSTDGKTVKTSSKLIPQQQQIFDASTSYNRRTFYQTPYG